MDKTNDTDIVLDKETIDKIKAAARATANTKDNVPDDELGEPAKDTDGLTPVEEVKNEAVNGNQGVKQQRKVFFEPRVKIDVYDSEKLVDTLYADRNILEIGLVVKSLTEDKFISIFALEDKKVSDPVPEGEDEPLYPIFDIVKKPVKEAFRILGQQVITEPACLIEFQRLCEFMSFRSTLQAANIVLVFKGNQPGGFSYFSSCISPDASTYTSLYDFTNKQNKQYKERVKESRPDVRFEDDSNIITHL